MLPEEAQQYLQAAHNALHEENPKEALEWVEMGLNLVPDEKTFLNYKAVALGQLKRNDEAKAVVEYTAKLYPDYLFARCAMAQLCAQEKRFDEAEEWLKPLRNRQRFHHSEFRAFAMAQAALLRARGEKKGAESWIQMWQQMEREQLEMEFDDDDEDEM
jgi:tetratricopeptide (TPR) repeat protein